MMINKKILMMLAVVSLALNANAAAKKGVLRMGVGSGLQPYSYTDEKGGLIGFDIEIAKALAKKLGVEPDLQEMDFAAFIPALMTEKVDLLISALTITQERAKKVDFSEPYYAGRRGYVVGVPIKNTDIHSADDLHKKKVSCVIGSVQAEILKDMKDVEVVEYPSINDALLAVIYGKVDATLNPYASVYGCLESQCKGKMKVVGKQLPARGIGVAVKKGNKELLAKVNKALDELKKEGVIDKAETKYFPK
jgi:polar amino acid transport system substrate-binding protein